MNLVEYEVINRMGYITLNRPEKKNALNHELVGELKAAFRLAEADQHAKVIVLRAKGDVFCSGADLESLQKLQTYSYEENVKDSMHLKELFLQIYTLRKVVIAQIQGHALAGGCGLATVCDFAFAVPEAKLGYTEVKIGFVPAIVMVFLLRKVGEHRAKQMLLSGELINAEEAMKLGLINRIAAKNDISDSVGQFAQKLITGNSIQSMELTKRMIAEVQSLSLDEGLDLAVRMNAEARATNDCKRGIAAFLNKEPLTW
jgi:methylglutaconyl-CoA hydratase